MVTNESHPEPDSEHSRAVDTESSQNLGQSAEPVNPAGAGSPAAPEGAEISGTGIPRAGANPREKRLAILALLLLVPAPSLGVALSMMIDGTQGTTLGKAAYFLSKVWILALPIVWTLWVDRQRLSLSPARKGGFGVASGLGLVIAVSIAGGFWLFGDRIIDATVVRNAAIANGIGSLPIYLAFVAYLTFVNSLLEEFVWRWFVFRKCETLVGGGAAVICSALFFTIHHVFALKAQMDWTPTLLGSAGVFIGGAVWSWCYLRFRSVWPGYVSHLIVDAAVFVVGWYLIFEGAGA